VKIRFLTSIASKEFSYAYGSEVDLPKKQAELFVKAGVATPTEVDNEPETATAPPAKETTSTRKGRKKDANNSGDGEKAT